MFIKNTISPEGMFIAYSKISAIPVAPPLRSLALEINKFIPNEEINVPQIISIISRITILFFKHLHKSSPYQYL